MKLTQKEKKWVDDVNKLLAKCPSKRLGFFTIGDNNLNIYDATKDKEIGQKQDEARSYDCDFGPACEALNALADERIWFTNPVHSTCG